MQYENNDKLNVARRGNTRSSRENNIFVPLMNVHIQERSYGCFIRRISLPPNYTNEREFNDTSLSTNNSEFQGDLSQLIQNFDKINIKEIDPIAISSIQENPSTEIDFNMIVDEINNLIFKLLNKGFKFNLVKQQVIEYFNDHNINSQEFYNWLLNNQNSLNSIFLLGFFNYHGIETNKNDEKAFNLFINSSEKNHILAQYFVGEFYLYGYGTIKNGKLAIEYYKKVVDKNFTPGQVSIGYCYSNGIGVEKDLIKEIYWYKKAAKNGNLMAIYNLGIIYEDGIGIEKDNNKAFKLFKQSAEGGYLDGIMMLGYCYDNGIGTKIDKYKAFELYQNAANLGNDIAQNNLALMYEEGDGIAKDTEKAIYWYEKSAKQGYGLAKNNLSNLLDNLYFDY
ncbi:HCP-like protein [Rhizophagus irregularis]|uniref:HCP-like protein n=2 Tax=Rhizophagus irregularis TaxID=588596 RepID=A0A2N1NE49_9GLOM|nr:HCP-like protein [Rhizophagus irregularis]